MVVDQPVEIWGLHGSERIYPDGRRELEQAPSPTQRKLDELREYLRHNNLGGEFEDKPNAAVMHWRGASPRTAKFIETRTRELFEPIAKMEGLMLLEFEGGLELRVGRDKGGAIDTLIAEAPPGTPVAYVGDDLTDEAAFRALSRVESPHLSVLMRPEQRETAADVWLRPPSGIRMFLKRWYKALQRVAAEKGSLSGRQKSPQNKWLYEIGRLYLWILFGSDKTCARRAFPIDTSVEDLLARFYLPRHPNLWPLMVVRLTKYADSRHSNFTRPAPRHILVAC